MSSEELGQLGFIEAGPGRHLEVFLVSPQRVHLELEEVDVLSGGGLTGDRLARLLALPPFPLGPDGLNERLVVFTDVDVVSPGVELELQLLLSHGPLDLLAV